jgi:hypothetical protein
MQSLVANSFDYSFANVRPKFDRAPDSNGFADTQGRAIIVGGAKLCRALQTAPQS